MCDAPAYASTAISHEGSIVYLLAIDLVKHVELKRPLLQ